MGAGQNGQAVYMAGCRVMEGRNGMANEARYTTGTPQRERPWHKRVREGWARLGQRWPVGTALREALAVLTPFIGIAALLQLIDYTVLARGSFFAVLTGLTKWLPYETQLHHVVNLASSSLWGLLGIAVGGLVTGQLVTNRYRALATGTTILTLATAGASANTPMLLGWPLLGIDSLLVAMVVSVVISACLRRWPTEGKAVHLAWLVPVLILLLALTWELAWARYGAVFGGLLDLRIADNAVMLFIFPVISALLWWAGLPGPLALLTDWTSGTAASANLTAALSGTKLSAVPHPLLLMTTYAPFGNLGGVGMLLALLIVLTIKEKRLRLIPWLTVLFNLPAATLLTTPVLFNRRLLIPFLMAPLTTQLIAAGAITTHLMPPAVYPVPQGTPGLLVAYLGTNGSFSALVVTFVCLIVGVLWYWPFVTRKAVAPDAQ